MKKAKPNRPPISKTAYQIVKISGGTDKIDIVEGNKAKTNNDMLNKSINNSDNDNLYQSEGEIMGESSNKGRKSDAMEKNLMQMVNVLNYRLGSLESAAKTRLKLCEEDLNPKSKKSSSNAAKIVDEYDEVVPRSLKDVKLPALSHKDNLVSSDTVYIDPYHLVVKTKMATETSKKLEMNLEEAFGIMNLREMKSKKAKIHTEKSKKSEQQKNETKRLNRNKIEKRLQVNMETFLTRSVMETEFYFKVPEHLNQDAEWPIAVKWSKYDPRSNSHDNAEGPCDPDLLLQYAIERINLPSGKNVFNWLIRQPMLHRYFVTLFWLIKVKYFEHNKESSAEAYLLRIMSIEYKRIMDLLSSRSHAEHEKDFVYKFLPFVLTNAIYFGFYYLFPGSRHIYSKGFKKTIYMQLVQLMHGVQLCVTTVKVAWSKLFPEDIHDDEEGEDNTGESFPVQIAFNNSLNKPKNHNKSRQSSPSATENRLKSNSFDLTGASGGIALHNDTHSSLTAKVGYLAHNENPILVAMANAVNAVENGDPMNPNDANNNDDGWNDLFQVDRGGSFDGNTRTHTRRVDSMQSFFEGATRLGYVKGQNKVKVKEFSKSLTDINLLNRTSLKPLTEKPNSRYMVKHQNNIEVVNVKEISPQVQLYLTQMDSNVVKTKVTQSMRRTIPIGWCKAGGSETYHKRHANFELINEIAAKASEAEHDFNRQNYKFHKKKLETKLKLDSTLSKILGSGSQSVSRYSLDLVRRQKEKKNTGITKESPTHVEDLNLVETVQQAQYDDSDLDKFLAEI
eukprot:gene10870-14588_t